MKVLMRSALAVSLLTAVLSGCYVIPVDHAGNPIYPPYVVPGSPSYVAPGSPPGKVGPVTLPARLYPANDLAVRTGVVTGAVTNMMTGKGRFNLSYKGEAYTGEATRVSDDERRGVASAFSPSGGYMSCEYQMNNPRQGAGTCTFSDGAEYKLHIGG